ncbi:MAG TPA: DUF47 family protein [bacterium]|nr:DUF47 family protein [bacterium]
MERSRNIFVWLGQREKKEILNAELQHMELSFECVKEMKNCFQAYYENKTEEKNNAISKVKEYEKKGDEIRKTITLELSKGYLMPADREDLLLLNTKLNDIADSAKGVARLFEFIEGIKMPELSKSLLDNSIIAVKSIEKLKNAIVSLIKDEIDRVLEECSQIEILEEEGDDKRRELLGQLLKSEISLPISIIFYEIIDTTENLIDTVKNTADLVRVLAIKLK